MRWRSGRGSHPRLDVEVDVEVDVDLDLDLDLDLVLNLVANPVPLLDASGPVSDAFWWMQADGVASASLLSVQDRDSVSD